MRTVFITGGTGYMGRKLVERLVVHGDRVLALVRAGSETKLPPGCEPVPGNALNAATFEGRVAPADTFVQLIGVAHPSPAKAEQFRTVDLAAIQAGVAAAKAAKVSHFVYVSVAQPAPVMKAFLTVRQEGERLVGEAGFAATILRPWYVLGPGHRWPYLLLPVYGLLRSIPATRESAHRLGLVTLDQMVSALEEAVAHPPTGVKVVEVPQIRNAGVHRERA